MSQGSLCKKITFKWRLKKAKERAMFVSEGRVFVPAGPACQRMSGGQRCVCPARVWRSAELTQTKGASVQEIQ